MGAARWIGRGDKESADQAAVDAMRGVVTGVGWGVLGVWMGAFAYILLLCTLMGWKFAQGSWKTIQMVSHRSTSAQ